jgi:hypothetical protein
MYIPSILKEPSTKATLRGFEFSSFSLQSSVNHTFSIGKWGGRGNAEVEKVEEYSLEEEKEVEVPDEAEESSLLVVE